MRWWQWAMVLSATWLLLLIMAALYFGQDVAHTAMTDEALTAGYQRIGISFVTLWPLGTAAIFAMMYYHGGARR